MRGVAQDRLGSPAMLIWYAVIVGFAGLLAWPAVEPYALAWARRRRGQRERRDRTALPPIAEARGLTLGPAAGGPGATARTVGGLGPTNLSGVDLMASTQKPTDADRGLTHGSSGCAADAAVEGRPKLEDRHIESPHAREAEPLVDNEKHDQLADKEEQSEDRQEALLDEGLEETFPGSDPVSVKRIT